MCEFPIRVHLPWVSDVRKNRSFLFDVDLVIKLMQPSQT